MFFLLFHKFNFSCVILYEEIVELLNSGLNFFVSLHFVVITIPILIKKSIKSLASVSSTHLSHFVKLFETPFDAIVLLVVVLDNWCENIVQLFNCCISFYLFTYFIIKFFSDIKHLLFWLLNMILRIYYLE